MTKPTPEEQRQRTLHAMHASGLDLYSVWIRYFSITGNVDEFEVDAYLNGLITLIPADRDLVSRAVNELIDEIPRPTAPYSSDYSNKLQDPNDLNDPAALNYWDALAALNDPNSPNDKGRGLET